VSTGPRPQSSPDQQVDSRDRDLRARVPAKAADQDKRPQDEKDLRRQQEPLPPTALVAFGLHTPNIDFGALRLECPAPCIDGRQAVAGSGRGVQLCGSIGSVELGVRLRLTESRDEEGR
jgi:hypothetical protein